MASNTCGLMGRSRSRSRSRPRRRSRSRSPESEPEAESEKPNTDKAPSTLRKNARRAIGLLQGLPANQGLRKLLALWDKKLRRDENRISITEWYSGCTADSLTWHFQGLESEDVSAFTTSLNLKLLCKHKVRFKQAHCRYYYELETG